MTGKRTILANHEGFAEMHFFVTDGALDAFSEHFFGLEFVGAVVNGIAGVAVGAMNAGRVNGRGYCGHGRGTGFVKLLVFALTRFTSAFNL